MSSEITGTVSQCLVVPAGEVASVPVDSLRLEFEGPAGDRHCGLVRPSTSREPWYPRGTIIRNNRQVSVVSDEEMREVAAAMGLAELAPAWIGANLCVAGIGDFSALPPGTRLAFSGGAVLHVEAENGPCKIAGRSIAAHVAGRDELDLLFPKVAKHRRGLVASVEKPGVITAGERFEVHMLPVHPRASGQGTLL